MALPPTPLTTLLNGAPTPDAMYDALKSGRCLSLRGQVNRAEMVAMISDTLARRAARDSDGPPMPGPTPIDELARELVDSPYLSLRGKELSAGRGGYDSSADKRWWQFWK